MNNYSVNQKTIRAQSTNGGKGISKLLWILGCSGIAVIAVIILLVAGVLYFNTSRHSNSIVFIREPLNSDSLRIGEPVPVRAVAKGDITQVEIWVDDQLIQFENNDIPGGVSPFPIITTWYPTHSGMHTISARSTDSSGKQSVNQVVVTVLDNQDSDGDLIPDHLDNCPEQAGTDAGLGCMDQDFDGIPDEVDACPDTAGMPEDGCPAPSENDRDGDGVTDPVDVCPDVAGSPGAHGCLDQDGDGYADTEDECPGEPGTTGACPTIDDMDSDGIPDGEDACPTSWGTANFAGCSDSDADGVIDHEDTCPTTSGSADNNGCPIPHGVLPPPPDPEDIEVAGDGSNPLQDMGFELAPPRYLELITLELSAHELEIRGDYQRVWCYLVIDGNARDPDYFEPSGQNFWNIDEVLGGDNSISIPHEETEPIPIILDCLGEENGGRVTQLVYQEISHGEADWTGRELYFATDDHNFILKYQICRGSCGDSQFQAPRLSPIIVGNFRQGPYRLYWQWDGRSANIDGFHVNHYRDGELIAVYNYGSTIRRIGIDDYVSPCGHTDEFEVYAYKFIEGTMLRSPSSNIEAWVADPCQYNAIVTFDSLDIHNPQQDEDGLYQMGPISGYLSAGDGEHNEWLDFEARWFSALDTRSEGLWLGEGIHSFQDIFDWIHREMASCLGRGCHSNDYFAPEITATHLQIEERQNIFIFAHISEHDTGITNPNEYIYYGRHTIHFDDLALNSPVRFVLEGEVANLIVVVELIEAQ
ncbi:MAG: thrombospondin type 3 repeat-containing protein [Anaerolineaceae bacterium]|nr:thrombospondin type 3 repeat-containing protein [Anaerolineaceae bacterium]